MARLNLVQRLGILGLTGASLAGIAGCAQTSDEELTGAGALGILMQLSPYANPLQQATGAALSAGTQMEQQRRVAREGRSEVNVNVQGGNVSENNGGYQQQQIIREPSMAERLKEKYEKGENVVFACNYFRDFDRDNSIYVDEYINIKNEFRKNEKITLVSVIYENLEGELVETEVLDSNGRVVKLRREFIDKKLNGYVISCEIESQELACGGYTAICSTKNRYLGKFDFKVVE